MHDSVIVAIVDCREHLLHYVGSLPIIDTFLLHNETEKFPSRTELCHYVIVEIVLVALEVLEHIRVVYRFQHTDLIQEVGFTRD